MWTSPRFIKRENTRNKWPVDTLMDLSPAALTTRRDKLRRVCELFCRVGLTDVKIKTRIYAVSNLEIDSTV